MTTVREVNQWLYQVANARKGPQKREGTTPPKLPQKEIIGRAATSFLEGMGRRGAVVEIAEDCNDYGAVLAGMMVWFREGVTEILRKKEEEIEAKYPSPRGTGAGAIQQTSRHIAESLCGWELWEKEAHIDAIYQMNNLDAMSMVQIGNRNVSLCFAQERHRNKVKELTFRIALCVSELALQGEEIEFYEKASLFLKEGAEFSPEGKDFGLILPLVNVAEVMERFKGNIGSPEVKIHWWVKDRQGDLRSKMYRTAQAEVIAWVKNTAGKSTLLGLKTLEALVGVKLK